MHKILPSQLRYLPGLSCMTIALFGACAAILTAQAVLCVMEWMGSVPDPPTQVGTRLPKRSTHLLAEVCVRAIEELDAGEGAGELAAARDPGDGGALIEEVGGLEELDALLLDEAHPQHLALLLIRDQLRWQHLCMPPEDLATTSSAQAQHRGYQALHQLCMHLTWCHLSTTAPPAFSQHTANSLMAVRDICGAERLQSAAAQHQACC